jgi:hypothetical protein
MSGPPREPDRIKVEIDIDADNFDEIEEIATQTGEGRDEIHRRALRLGLAAIRRGDQTATEKPA